MCGLYLLYKQLVRICYHILIVVLWAYTAMVCMCVSIQQSKLCEIEQVKMRRNNNKIWPDFYIKFCMIWNCFIDFAPKTQMMQKLSIVMRQSRTLRTKWAGLSIELKPLTFAIVLIDWIELTVNTMVKWASRKNVWFTSRMWCISWRCYFSFAISLFVFLLAYLVMVNTWTCRVFHLRIGCFFLASTKSFMRLSCGFVLLDRRWSSDFNTSNMLICGHFDRPLTINQNIIRVMCKPT